MGRSLADVALHEAGHVAAAIALGHEVVRCTIADDCTGCTTVRAPAERTAERTAREKLVIVASGDLAEVSCGPLGRWWEL